MMVKGKDYPDWYEDRSLDTIKAGYLLEGETPKEAYIRIARASAERLKKPELTEAFFNLFWKGWMGPASPVLSNMGTDRGMPVSCFGLELSDSIDGIYTALHEMAALTKNGGGVGNYVSHIRPRGAPIKGNGKSEGVIPWIKIFDSAILATSQGSTRRGSAVVSLDVDHGDIEEFLRIRRPEGDINRQCLNINHAVCIDDEFMKKIEDPKNTHERSIWQEVLKTRFETGEPYLTFVDNANRANPLCYEPNNLRVNQSQICTEIFQHSDDQHTFVCCLSSMNLAKYNEWKDTNAVYLATWFLDGVMQEFIDKSEGIPGLERARRSAIKGRALGLGVMGWHTLLQSEMTPMDSLRSRILNRAIFKSMQHHTREATQDLAKEYGSPLWCKGFGIRNTHTTALAPTVTNATICGGISPSIEPWAANSFNLKSAKGTFFVTNKQLEAYLEGVGLNTRDVWRSINEHQGSVQHLDIPKAAKDVFCTAREISQDVLIELAAERQPFIDQGQSLNLFYSIPKEEQQRDALVQQIHEHHYKAWERGLKSLYYLRSDAAIRTVFKEEKVEAPGPDECKACEG